MDIRKAHLESLLSVLRPKLAQMVWLSIDRDGELECYIRWSGAGHERRPDFPRNSER